MALRPRARRRRGRRPRPPPALRELDAYIGHTNWTGIGGVGTAALGAILFKEEITGARVVSFASITGGAFLLRLTAV